MQGWNDIRSNWINGNRREVKESILDMKTKALLKLIAHVTTGQDHDHMNLVLLIEIIEATNTYAQELPTY